METVFSDHHDASPGDHRDQIADEQAAAAPNRVRRLLRSRKAVVGGGVVFLLILGIALLAPVLAPHDPLQQNLGDNFKPPMWKAGGSSEYPLGTDPLGRDLLSRIMYGARYSLAVSIGAVIVGSLLGFLLGIVSGFYGRATDTVIMRIGDIQLAFPFVLFAVAILAVSPNRTIWHLIIVLGVSSWVLYARVVRSRVLSERSKDYATAAKALGASRQRVLFTYILPNVWQALPPIALLNLAYFVIVESLLSFLALGLSPPTPSWGSILADGRQYMMLDPWMALFPGFAIIITVISISLVADGLADLIDPKAAHGLYRRVPLPAAPSDHLVGSENAPLLSVRNLSTAFPMNTGVVLAVDDVSFDIPHGSVLGVVGESGSGKSTLGLSIIQLLDSPGQVTNGTIAFEGQDLTRVSNREIRSIRGNQIGMIFQDPGNSLTPVLTVGYQLEETARQTGRMSKAQARIAAREALAVVRIADPDRIMKAYSFELSGGMQQRVMIALAMIANPELLILDEPTSALDVTTQAQLLSELDRLRVERDLSIMFITHDIALLDGFADDILVLYAGRICEVGPYDQVIANPQHPYSQALLDAVELTTDAATGRLVEVGGDPPDPQHVATGCPFSPRCPYAMTICTSIAPPLVQTGERLRVACHLVEGETAGEV